MGMCATWSCRVCAVTLLVIISSGSFFFIFLFFFNDTATTEIYTLSLHDALPIWVDDDSLLLSHRVRQDKMIDAEQLSNITQRGAMKMDAHAFAEFKTSYFAETYERLELVNDMQKQRSEEHTSELQSH